MGSAACPFLFDLSWSEPVQEFGDSWGGYCEDLPVVPVWAAWSRVSSAMPENFVCVCKLKALLSFCKEMTSEEKSTITNLSKCDFTHMSQYFKAQSEARKQMSKEEKQVPVGILGGFVVVNIFVQSFPLLCICQCFSPAFRLLPSCQLCSSGRAELCVYS